MITRSYAACQVPEHLEEAMSASRVTEAPMSSSSYHDLHMGRRVKKSSKKGPGPGPESLE